MAEDNEHYRVREIQFFNNRVGIAMQNINGPCPLLSIANVLSLRNQIQINPDQGYIDNIQLLSMVTNKLLEQASGSQGSNQQQIANTQKNIEDGLNAIPKLATGIDVNIKFSRVDAFEFTNEIAIFDLLGLRLLHGWLYDKEDKEIANIIGEKSYDQLVIELTNFASYRVAQSSKSQHTDQSTTSEKQNTSVEDNQTKVAIEQVEPSVQESPLVETLAPPEALEKLSLQLNTGENSQTQNNQGNNLDFLSNSHNTAQQAEASQSGAGAPAQAPETPLPQQDPITLKCDHQANLIDIQGSGVAQHKSVDVTSQGKDKAEKEHQDYKELVMRQFLENSSSQLTYAGLQELHQTLGENQLAIFFRNNHFNTLFKHEDGLFLLVTDQGYAGHTDVVWEQLDMVDGDTDFYNSQFERYQAQSVQAPQKTVVDDEPPSADADLALALQLQEEERIAQQQHLQQQQIQNQQGSQQQSFAGQQRAATSQNQQQFRPYSNHQQAQGQQGNTFASKFSNFMKKVFQ